MENYNSFSGIIAGTPRSGTSIMSKCIHDYVGEENFLGSGFLSDEQYLERRLQQFKHDDLKEYFRKNIILNKIPDDTKDMNPDGFYECIYTVNGIKNTDLNLNGKYCKIVNQGIANSNAKYIDKIVYMARDPHSIAKSQEKLKRVELDTVVNENGESPIIHSPEMFIRVTFAFARWQLIHQKPLLMVEYNNLIENPEKELERVREFLGFDNRFVEKHEIKKSLKRSKPEAYPHHLWQCADEMYEKVLHQDWQGIISVYQKHNKELIKSKLIIGCVRLNENMSYHECQNCLNNLSTRQNFRNRADMNDINWHQQPCMYLSNECEKVGVERKTIDETIKNNHWNDTQIQYELTVGTKLHNLLDTAKDVITNAFKGDDIFLSVEDQTIRWNICQECPFRNKNKCGSCGCNIGLSVKIKSKTCPKNKWPEIA